MKCKKKKKKKKRKKKIAKQKHCAKSTEANTKPATTFQHNFLFTWLFLKL